MNLNFQLLEGQTLEQTPSCTGLLEAFAFIGEVVGRIDDDD